MWWKQTAEGYLFLDGDSDPPTQPSGPQLRHFRSVTLKDVYTSAHKVWDQLLETQTTTGIVQYSTAGDPIQRLATTTREGTEEPTEEADDTDETSASGCIAFDITALDRDTRMGESEAPRVRTGSENTSPGQGEHTHTQSLEQEMGGAKLTEKATESPEIRAHEEGRSGQADELGRTQVH